VRSAANPLYFSDEPVGNKTAEPACYETTGLYSLPQNVTVHNIVADGSTDDANFTDADIYKDLGHYKKTLAYSLHGDTPEMAMAAHSQSVEPPPVLPAPPASPICPEGGGEGPPITDLVVNVFPLGNAGAPAPDTDQQLSPESHIGAPGVSIWAPFHSWCDWEFAHWAKTHGAMSSAVADLLWQICW